MNFLSSEKIRQTEWKLNTKHLSREAKKPGLIRGKLQPWALPVTCAHENLHESIRDGALKYFRQNRINWHMSAQMNYPTNHLCSSQVMAVNCMFPFMYDHEGLKAFLSPIFPDTHEVLPIEAPGQYLAFEWIGPINYLHEEPKLGTRRRRGLGNTSIDFAILVRTSTQKTRMLLGEWKYVENYPRVNIRRRSDGTDRYSTYAPFLEDINSPILLSKLQSIDDLFYEPIYQAVRHLLMAHEIKRHHSEIDEVVVLHMRSERNQFLLENPSPGLAQGETVYEDIRAVIREPGMLVDVGYEEMFTSEHFPARGRAKSRTYLTERYSIGR